MSHPIRSLSRVERGTRWNPWAALRARPWLYLTIRPMRYGDAFFWPCPDGRCAIVLGEHLSRTERRCALAHELVHAERGGGCSWTHQPAGWEAVVAREEAHVDDEVARRLVPLGELSRMVEVMCDLGDGVEVGHVCEEFDVTPRIAARALLLLQDEAFGERRAG